MYDERVGTDRIVLSAIGISGFYAVTMEYNGNPSERQFTSYEPAIDCYDKTYITLCRMHDVQPNTLGKPDFIHTINS
jgi:hypothetical protein